jgi:hypothetical protein
MSQTYIPPSLRRTIAERDNHRCSYCQTAESIVGADFTIDHIVPESLGGATASDNLCLACWSCNLYKGARLTAIDPVAGDTVRLFHPVKQRWSEHFYWQEDGVRIVGITSAGRATVDALRLNCAALVRARGLWIAAGWHPPVHGSVTE